MSWRLSPSGNFDEAIQCRSRSAVIECGGRQGHALGEGLHAVGHNERCRRVQQDGVPECPERRRWIIVQHRSQLGGIVRQNSSSVAGSYAKRILEDISCGVLFLGVDGIDLDFGFSITNLTEASLNQKMIECAQVVAVLADSTKFGRRGLGKVCNFDQVQYVVTDDKVHAAAVKALEDRGIKVVIA